MKINQTSSLYSTLPYAHYAYSRIAKFAGLYKVDRVLDIASEGFHNREMFDAGLYIGADLNINSLQGGLEKHRDSPSIACMANMANLPELYNVVNMVVCTFTMIFIPPKARTAIVKRLSDMVKKDGHILIEIPKTSDVPSIKKILEKDYKKVELIFFHSWMSRYYQRKMIRRLVKKPLSREKDFLTKTLSFLFEDMYPNMSLGNKNAFLIGHYKKLNSIHSNKSIKPIIERIGYRLYRDINCPHFKKLPYTSDSSELNILLSSELKQEKYRDLTVLLIYPRKSDMVYMEPLFKELETKEVSFQVKRFVDNPQKADVLIYLDFQKPDTTYLHYNLYRLAHKQIVFTYPLSKSDRVDQMF